MSINNMDFKNLSNQQQEQYYDTLWHWIFSNDMTYDLYKFCRDEMSSPQSIDVTEFFNNYCEMINHEDKEEGNSFEATYQKELKEFEYFKLRGNTDKKDMDIMHIVSSVKTLYEGRDDEDAQMVTSLLMTLCASNGMGYPNDETEVDYLIKNIKFGGMN